MYAERSREGLFTGYFEASLKGSKTRHGPYQTPILKKPDDLVMVDLGDFRDDLKGRRIAGRVIDTRLKPFEDRETILNLLDSKITKKINLSQLIKTLHPSENFLSNSSTLAIKAARLARGRDWSEAHAPIWLPRPRESK